MRGIVFVVAVLMIYAASNGMLIKLFDAAYNAANSAAPKGGGAGGSSSVG